MTPEDYRQQFVGDFTTQEHPLAALVREYHQRCEDYDRTVCTGPIGRDGILPATRHEWGLTNRNSLVVLADIRQRADTMGYTREELRAAFRQYYQNGGY